MKIAPVHVVVDLYGVVLTSDHHLIPFKSVPL